MTLIRAEMAEHFRGQYLDASGSLAAQPMVEAFMLLAIALDDIKKDLEELKRAQYQD
jgi:hypothetical protein